MSADTTTTTTAISTVADPLSPAGDKVLIFSSSRNNTLRYERRAVGGREAAAAAAIFEDSNSSAPPLSRSAQLAAFVYRDVVSVYGITGADKADLQIALLSPVYAPRKGIKPVSGSLGGCSEDGGAAAYLYVFAENDEGKTRLYELKLGKRDDKLTPLETTSFYGKSQLFALSNPVTEQRWLVYQQTDNTISLYGLKAGKDNPIPGSANHARQGTPLTACIVPAEGSRPARVYVYFVDKDNILQSANSKVADELLFNADDEKPSAVPGNFVASSGSQLATFLGLQAKRNIVYGVQQSGTRISPMYEAWKTQ